MSSLHLPSGATLDTVWRSSASTEAIQEELWLVNRYVRKLWCELNLRQNLRESPLLRLPEEILDRVLDNAPTCDLRHCALVCSSLAPLARSRTLHSLRIFCAGSLVRAVWFARYAPGLYRFTRDLIVCACAPGILRQRGRETLDEDPFAEAIGLGEVTALRTDAEAEAAISEVFALLKGTVYTLYVHVPEDDTFDPFYFKEGRHVFPILANVTSLTISGGAFSNMDELFSILAAFPYLSYLKIVHSSFMAPRRAVPPQLRGKLPLVGIDCSWTSGADWLSLSHVLAQCATPGSLRSICYNATPDCPWESVLRDGFGRSMQEVELVLHPALEFEDLVEVLNGSGPDLVSLKVWLSWSDTVLESLLSHLSRVTVSRLERISIVFISKHMPHDKARDEVLFCDATLRAVARMLGSVALKCVSIAFPGDMPDRLDAPSTIKSLSKERVLRYTGAARQVIWREHYALGTWADGEDVRLYTETHNGFDGPRLLHFGRRGECACVQR